MNLIKNPSKNDIAAMLEIEKVSYPKPWDEKSFLVEYSKFLHGSAVFLVVKDSDTMELTGYAIADIITDFLHVSNVAVKPEARRKKTGEMLMKALEAEAFKRGLTSLTLEVRAINEPAVNLYNKLGYAEKGRREKYYDGTDDAILMWKYL